MVGFLRFVGVLNASIWFGSAIFYIFAVSPGAFSPEMEKLLGPKFFPYYSGAILDVLTSRYFTLHLVCGLVGLMHLMADWLYFGRSNRGSWCSLLLGLLAAALLGSGIFLPHLRETNRVRTAAGTKAEEREKAEKAYRAWRASALGLNLAMLSGLGVYLWRMTSSGETTRFTSAAKFRS